MDPESWKMAATNFKFLNQGSDTTARKTLQVYHGKYLTTERFVKRTTSVLRNEESAKLEARYIHASRKASHSHYPMSVEHGEVKRAFSEESRTNASNKYSINKWAESVPNQTHRRENVALTAYSRDSHNLKSPFGVEVKRSPVLMRDASRTFIPQREKTNSQIFREGVKAYAATYTDAKDSVSVLCNRTKVPGGKHRLINTTPLQGNEEVHCEDKRYLGIPFNHSHKRIMVQNNVPHHSETSGPWKRMKINDQESSARTTDRVHQKMFEQHRLPYKDIPSGSGAFTHTDGGKTVACRSTVNRIQRDKCRSSLTDKTKGELTVSKQKDKPIGSSTFRRFLLIDSQGLPYTVVVEEPKSTKLSNPINEYSSDSTHAGVSKSLAPRKVYKCPVCFRIFEYLSYLQRHSIAHSQQKPHVCKICGKAFKRTSHLTRHKYTHFGGKPFQCQICQRRFRDAGELTRHQQSHTGERPHQCEVCNMCFGEHSTLQRHMLSKHMK
ncbi:zinc finger protein 99-like [Pseudophryne corroboree]|uniref:zinc finger protein 99-like n=1 Tax=Pseudophryne corroboree TaxID=495146 RepID=UPI0030816E17